MINVIVAHSFALFLLKLVDLLYYIFSSSARCWVELLLTSNNKAYNFNTVINVAFGTHMSLALWGWQRWTPKIKLTLAVIDQINGYMEYWSLQIFVVPISWFSPFGSLSSMASNSLTISSPSALKISVKYVIQENMTVRSTICL